MNKELLYQNKKIFYRTIGSGRPVILIHGFGENSDVWKNQAPSNSPQGGGLPSAHGQLNENSLLNGKFKFIIPDLPGSGKSEMIDDMSMEGMSEVIKIILDIEVPLIPIAIGTPQEGTLNSDNFKRTSAIAGSVIPPSGGGGACIEIGHSMGGYILLAFMEKYGEHVSAFGLFHSSAYPDSEEKKVTRRKGIDFIDQHGAFEFLKTATPNLFSPNSKEQSRSLSGPNVIEEIINQGHNFSSAALVSYYEAMMQRPDRTAILQKATVPVLFIMGKYDNAIPLDDMLKQCHLPEKSYIHILRKSGHMGMLEEALESSQILKDFLSFSTTV